MVTTIKDVADKAKVSVATVSRVLNNKGYIKEKTRKNVERVIKELNYTPNSVARTLYTKQSNTIGVLIPDIANPFFSELYTAIEFYAEQQNQQLFLFNSNYNVKKEKKLIEQLNSKLVDSAIIISENLTEKDLSNLHIPIVILDRKISEDISSITVNNYKGSKKAVRYLINSKCKMIAHITGPKYNGAAIERTKGFYDEMNRNNKLNYIVAHGNYNVKDTVELFSNLLIKHPTIDGVFAGNDIIAMGVVKSLSRKKKKKVSVVGFDGISLLGDITPEVTTMRQPINDMAEKAIDIIMKEQKKVHKIFDAELLIKDT